MDPGKMASSMTFGMGNFPLSKEIARSEMLDRARRVRARKLLLSRSRGRICDRYFCSIS